MFNVRVVSLDHYLAKPIDELYASEDDYLTREWQEPVIRIFGATSGGVKTCVHVHGVYPYIYVPYKGGDNPERDALLLGVALDEALKTSFNSKVLRFVYKVILISGIPLYGYHSKNRKFFKIYFFNPYHIRKASDLLLSGAILGQKFQPHEAHIPYGLQFMMDYNIYGMSFAVFSKVRYRRNVENPDSLTGVKEEDILSHKIKKITRTRLEVDALASDIMNRVSEKAIGGNPGLRAIWEEERELRRRQDRLSAITIPESQSRPEVKICPTEIMYKDRLAEKLRLIPTQESGATLEEHVYPAEVPDDEDILEASAIHEGPVRGQSREDVEDVNGLIDERMVSVIAERFAESEGSEESEAESVPGRNQRAEEEAELEDEEEGVDMTQPLDSDERDDCGGEGSLDEEGRETAEDVFWKNMADKIYQLDGAQESSSDSDLDTAPSGSTSEERTPDGPPDCSSSWSTNIMSILSEDSGCPTPSTVCQTPRTFWSNYSPSWLPHDQDDWTWNKSSEPFPDISAKNAADNLCDFPPAPKDLSSGEPFDFFNSNDGQAFPSGVTLLASASPSVDATPVNDVAAEPVWEPERPSVDRQKFQQVLKNFAGRKSLTDDQCCHLTLKQYIKDCKEIVSIDFKNLCNQEMIIIEYKSRNKKSVQNKYLVKPLEKFLESWNSAEKKAKEGLCKNKGDEKATDEGRNMRSVVNVVESKFGDTSRVSSVRVKSMEMAPEEGNGRLRSYNINGNVISQGKIKMKLIKSRHENVEKTLKSERRAKEMKNKEKNKKDKKRPERFTELDSKLINEINSSFEEYFKSLVKRKNLLSKRNTEEETDDDEDDEEEELAVEENKEDSSEDEKPGGMTVKPSNSDPIKFVTRFLSTFSRMPDMSPFSVTISLGSPRTSVPVQVNFQPPTILPRKHYTKKRRRKMKVENVDGPADGSSSSESDGEDAKERTRGKKRRKKEAYYKPLKVVVYGSPSVKEVAGKRRKPSEDKAKRKEDIPETTGEGRRNFTEDLNICREEAKESGLRIEEKAEAENLVKGVDVKPSSPDGSGSGKPSQEPDFIYDSDEERKRQRRRWLRISCKSSFKKIPQADTDPFTSSDDEELKRIREKLSYRKTQSQQEATKPVVKLTHDSEMSVSPELHSVPSETSQIPSPFTMSGNPLFASESNSPEMSNPSQNSDKPVSTVIFESSSSGNTKLDMTVQMTPLDIVLGVKTITPLNRPITRKEVLESMQHFGVVENEESAPFYSDPRDVTKAMEAGPRVLKIENRALSSLKAFKSSLDVMGTEERRNLLAMGEHTQRWHLVGGEDVVITPLKQPPSPKSVLQWLSRKDEEKESGRKAKVKVVKPLSPGQEGDSDEEMELSVAVSMIEAPAEKNTTADVADISNNTAKGSSDNSFQIRGVTMDNTFGFSHSVENIQQIKSSATHQYMDMLVMEVHVQTRKDLRPDPYYDPIRALFYAIAFDSPTQNRETGVIVVGEGFLSNSAVAGLVVHHVPSEKALIEMLLGFVKKWDPEILAGYEIEMHSWGYLIQRGFILEMNLPLLLGRVCIDDYSKKNSRVTDEGDDAEDIPKSVRHLRISGRIVLDIWRVLRHEVALTSYSFENVMYHLAQERHPLLSHERLTYCWEHPTHSFRHIVVDHYSRRVVGVIRILDQLDFISRTSELSRLFGIQFYEVLSRGSQFRVESMMLRLAKPLNYIPASPSVAQRAAMRAPASLPLILEPESLFYTDPVIVLDFQSLYPSMIIAYNYCFSTCLGRVENLGGREPFEFGCTHLQISPEELKSLENDVNISPAGVAFVKPNIRRGVLPTMLAEILETRLMVKKSMKENKNNKILQKVLFSRQLGLKLIANVTYGYTAANFSGRMPCIEVGDSVVSKGRETLHRAIQLVKNTPKWGARVVYGDTDSIFVLTPGKSRQEAFKIGAEIADAVTQDNPKPVKLKLEKVYQPCILQTKKRYVGYMYESPEQEKPVFEAKGIETVRRDGCPAIGKVLEKSLRILFDTRDVSLVKKYTMRQFSKLFQGRVNVQDLIFAKEYRGRKGYRPGACVPALHLARQWSQHDKRAEPRVKERVPYVIVSGPPGVPLIRLVRSPKDLLSDPSLRINAVYYITKALIPPMQRCFSLLGADVRSWYAEMPRKVQKNYKLGLAEEQKRSTISQYFATRECVICCQIANGPLCNNCEERPQSSVVCLNEKIRRWERCHEGILKLCRSCCGRTTEIECISLDCPVLFRRNQAERALEQDSALRELLIRFV